MDAKATSLRPGLPTECFDSREEDTKSAPREAHERSSEHGSPSTVNRGTLSREHRIQIPRGQPKVQGRLKKLKPLPGGGPKGAGRSSGETTHAFVEALVLQE